MTMDEKTDTYKKMDEKKVQIIGGLRISSSLPIQNGVNGNDEEKTTQSDIGH